MKDQLENQKSTRKSNRQRVPNSFYTEGINQLKRQPKAPREPLKPQRKKSRGYADEEDISYLNEQVERECSQQSGNWYPCKLPQNGATVKVQFVLNPPEEIPPPKKVQPPQPKTAKKSDLSTDLLSLFQKAIENVNEPEVPNRTNDQEMVKEVRPRMQPMARPKRPQDPEGKILKVERTADNLVINHSKLGQVLVEMQGSEQSEGQRIDYELVEQFREKLLNSQHFASLSLFN